MSVSHPFTFTAFADDLKLEHEKMSRETISHSLQAFEAAERVREIKLTRAAIGVLEERVLPVFYAAKAQIEATGVDVIVSKNWNSRAVSLSTPAVRFQCASAAGLQETGECAVSSKVAVFTFDGAALRLDFEGPDVTTALHPWPEVVSSDEVIVVWAVEETVASYYNELAKATYLSPALTRTVIGRG